MFNYNYLSDSMFLKEIDETPLKTQFAKITLLNRFDDPIISIEGQVTNGSININGSSSIRRSGNISMVATDKNYDITNIDNLISLNKRVAIEIGFNNIFGKYAEYPIIWFPQGIFIVSNAQISKNINSFNISLTLKDKMTLLNGENGGILPCDITHHPYYNELGESKRAKIRDILYTLLVTYGELPEDKIVIDNLPLRIKNTVSWKAKDPIYSSGSTNGFVQFNYYYLVGDFIQRQFDYNDSIGYTYTDFTYPGDILASSRGETIVSVLDKIKNVLGNYEYFFDINGVFRFQEIKNFINEGSSLDDWGEAINERYLINTTERNSVYTFDDTLLISSLTNQPQYNAIKNDIIVFGKSEKNHLRYHLIIDRKPEISSQTYSGIIYKDQFGVYRVTKVENASKVENPVSFNDKKPSDWRTQIYLQTILNDKQSYLSYEIVEEWPKIRNLPVELLGSENATTQGIQGNGTLWNHLQKISYSNDDAQKADTAAATWFLDVLDTKEVPSLDWMSISSIGRRQKVISDQGINCLFAPVPQDLILIEAGTDETATLREEAITKGETWTQVAPYIWKNMIVGGATSSAYDAIRMMLHEVTGYNESISVTTHPIYHLEPNTRISVYDSDTGINGDYVLKSFSVPFTTNGNMTLSCVKAVERI